MAELHPGPGRGWCDPDWPGTKLQLPLAPSADGELNWQPGLA
jgi:hypothetical protein